MAKLVPVDITHNLNDVQSALDEARTLLLLQHPHVVRFHDVFVHRDIDQSDPSRYFDFCVLVMEMCSLGTLWDMVMARTLTFEGLVDGMRQVR